MNAAHATGTSHLLRLFDNNSKQQFLIDTGAEVSVFPARRSDWLTQGDVILRAANNSSINTYGFKTLTLNFGLPRPLTWRFLVADVTQPIIGADFLLQHKLLVDLDQRRLIDTRNGTQVFTEFSAHPPPRLNSISTLSSSADPFTRLHQALAADSFTWSTSCQKAFEEAKQTLSEAVMLFHPQPHDRCVKLCCRGCT